MEAGGAGWRWHFAEFGTSKEAAHPFLRPAMLSKRGQVVEIFKEILAKKIAAAVRSVVIE